MQQTLKLQHLSRQFHVGLAARARDMATATSLSALHALLHRLVGAAGAYGDLQLADQARQLMHDLAPDSAQAMTVSQQAALAALCMLCHRLANQAIESGPPST